MEDDGMVSVQAIQIPNVSKSTVSLTSTSSPDKTNVTTSKPTARKSTLNSTAPTSIEPCTTSSVSAIPVVRTTLSTHTSSPARISPLLNSATNAKYASRSPSRASQITSNSLEEKTREPRLFVGGLPTRITLQKLEERFRKLLNGVVYIHLCKENEVINKGFCFLQFDCMASAEEALRVMSPNGTGIRVGDVRVHASWASPEQKVPEEVLAEVDGIHVGNLSGVTSKEHLREIFGGPRKVYKVVRMKNYAFVHFVDKTDARKAVETHHRAILDGATIEVTLAKPPPSALLNMAPFGRDHHMIMNPSSRSFMLNGGPFMMNPHIPPPHTTGFLGSAIDPNFYYHHINAQRTTQRELTVAAAINGQPGLLGPAPVISRAPLVSMTPSMVVLPSNSSPEGFRKRSMESLSDGSLKRMKSEELTGYNLMKIPEFSSPVNGPPIVSSQLDFAGQPSPSNYEPTVSIFSSPMHNGDMGLVASISILGRVPIFGAVTPIVTETIETAAQAALAHLTFK